MAFNNSLTAVLVPMIKSELGSLAKLFLMWAICDNLKPSTKSKSRVELIISLDCKKSVSLTSQINEMYDLFELDNIFSRFKIEYCDLTPEDNIYIRPGQKMPDKLPKLGMKSGPNLQFFHSINDFCAEQNTVFLNEVDCFPVQVDWLDKLSLLVSQAESFWVLGSPYRGWGKLGPDVLTHINGNALYGVGASGFKDFINWWHQGLLDIVEEAPWMAYDTFISYSYYKLLDPYHWSTEEAERFHQFSNLLCEVRYTGLIHNLAGVTETDGGMKVSLLDYLKTHPKATNAHGAFLFEEALGILLSGNKRSQCGFLLISGASYFWSIGDKKLSNTLRSHYIKGFNVEQICKMPESAEMK